MRIVCIFCIFLHIGFLNKIHGENTAAKIATKFCNLESYRIIIEMYLFTNVYTLLSFTFSTFSKLLITSMFFISYIRLNLLFLQLLLLQFPYSLVLQKKKKTAEKKII